MRYAHILSRVTGSPWFITPAALQGIADLLNARLLGARMDMPLPLPTPPDDPESPDPAEPAYEIRPLGGVAVVHVCGLLGKHLSMMETMCGGCDYDAVVSAVRAAAADPSISRIVLAVDSRGGMATGCPEAHAALLQIKADSGKPLIGFTDTQADSGGYYLLAACDVIFCTPTANLGCIGTIMQLVDASEANAKEGIKYLTIKSATMKDAGTSDRPPTSDEVMFFQAQVDYLGNLFRFDMERARPQISADVLITGLHYYGPQAVAKGLADQVVASLDEVLASLVSAA